jgi:hypothetical protein
MTMTERAGIERLRYWQGQTLRSRDLNDQLAYDASLRWWHNRAIHDTWGVVFGLAPRVDDQEIVLGPGLAYDCFGRELILSQPRGVALPPSDEGQVWELLLRAASEAPGPRPPVALVWLKPSPVLDPRLGVPLARGRLVEGTFRLEVSEGRPSTRAVSRPRLGSGATVRGKTDWRVWTLAHRRLGIGGIEVQIDTTAAGFEQTPCYFPALQGDAFARLGGRFVLVSFARVVRATPTSFVYSLWLPLAVSQGNVELDRAFAVAGVAAGTQSIGVVELARREISVCWLGIECRTSALASEKR